MSKLLDLCMDRVVLDYKIISYSKILLWLSELRLKTDFQDRNREGIMRKFSVKVQTLLNNFLLLSFLPSPGISWVERTCSRRKSRSNAGEDIVTSGCCSFRGVSAVLLSRGLSVYSRWHCGHSAAALPCGSPSATPASSDSRWLAPDALLNPWHKPEVFSLISLLLPLTMELMIPAVATFDTWHLRFHYHLSLFQCPFSKLLVPKWPGLSSKGHTPLVSAVFPQLSWLPSLTLYLVSSCCSRNVHASHGTLSHLQSRPCLTHPGAPRVALSTHRCAIGSPSDIEMEVSRTDKIN